MRGNGIHMSKNMRVFYALHSNRFKDFYIFLKSYELLIFIRKIVPSVNRSVLL